MALATFAVVWLVASPASASTPALGAEAQHAADLMSFMSVDRASDHARADRSFVDAGHAQRGGAGLASFADAAPRPRARALAPVCDPRGAIGFAPPPQIQDLELSLDVPADCVDDNPLETRNFVPGHGVQIDLASSQEPVAPTRALLPPVARSERLPVRAHADTRPSLGVRASLDRPPRA